MVYYKSILAEKNKCVKQNDASNPNGIKHYISRYTYSRVILCIFILCICYFWSVPEIIISKNKCNCIISSKLILLTMKSKEMTDCTKIKIYLLACFMVDYQSLPNL